jgi:hypothetical protein
MNRKNLRGEYSEKHNTANKVRKTLLGVALHFGFQFDSDYCDQPAQSLADKGSGFDFNQQV